jgi:choline-sulfatase
MSEKGNNLVILMSDEHCQKILGCYGHPFVHTPNLDKLAARGTRYANAYTNAPICVPARASFATGRYGHETGHWDNATPYFGEPESWGHRLQKNGNMVGSIGKLHYRNAEDPTGFDFQEIPMHLVNGVGDILGCVREPLPRRWKARAMADDAGVGESSYTAYDRRITSAAVDWLEERGREQSEGSEGDKPWAVFISMVAPHFPLIAPEEFYNLYKDLDLKPQKDASEEDHPWLKELRRCFVYDNFTDEKTRIALTSYFGLVSFMDANVGKILDALDANGLSDNTNVLYVSDHGDNMGERGLWGKSNMYEEAAAVPLIMAGPDVPKGRVVETATSLADVYPTVTDLMNVADDGITRPGKSLVALAMEEDDPNRAVFSEYHAAGAISGAFMIRKGAWKYVYYCDMAPQLFDLESDPEELNDLGTNDAHAAKREELHQELLKVCNPDEIDRLAKQDQAAIIEQHGGVEAVLERGGFGATPAPGEGTKFVQSN